MPEIITPRSINAWDYQAGKYKKCKPKDVGDIEMPGVQQLLDLADTYGVKVAFKVGNQYCFRYGSYNPTIFWAKD